jgi:hypothetical protein
MKKPNYSLDKRKREMKKQKKNEEKRLRKLNKGNPQPGDVNELPVEEVTVEIVAEVTEQVEKDQ